MAFKYPECEFCANHRGHEDICDQCEDGDCFEDVEDRASLRAPKPRKQPETVAIARDETFSQAVININSILKDPK